MPASEKLISKDEKASITEAYKNMVSSIKSDMDEKDRHVIDEAMDLAYDAHKKQRRKSGEPYIFHPIAVAKICAEEIGLGPTAIVSALLHDVVEDTPITQEEINSLFGDRIGLIVDGLTKLDGTYKTEHQQAENFKKVLGTLVQDVRVVLIKMADRLHNMRTIGSMPQAKKLKIAAETKFIFAPLAHRLGLYQIKTEFQDRCMQILNPDEYNSIHKELAESEAEREAYIKAFLKPLDSKLKKVIYDKEVEEDKREFFKLNYEVKGRTKSIYSIWNKIQKKGVGLNEIYDIFAVRFILDVADDKEIEKRLCWQVYSLITDVYKPIAERLKDWVTSPKANGYESLHTTVIGPDGKFVEVQIRTKRMDEIAEKGFAAHWKYKGQKLTHDHYGDWLDNVRIILESTNSNALEFINDFKTNLFQEEVYVYTPTGDTKVLPQGATALDFAFHIHSDVGYHCSAIKVNGKLVPMGYALKNGDKIEVMTRKNQKPSESWLNMVITGRARTKIRSAMKEEKKKKGELGKEALMRKFRNLKLNFDDNIEVLIKHYNYTTRGDLYYGIFTEVVKLQEINKRFDIVNNLLVEKADSEQGEAISDEPAIKEPGKKSKNLGKSTLIIDGQPASTFKYTFATCCNPLPGDDIFAYPVINSGLKIHRTNCPNATSLLANFGYRIVDAGWDTGNLQNFSADLKITGVDSGPGVIKAITELLATKLEIDIRSLNISGDQGYFTADIKVVVINKDQLNLIIKSLESIDEVSRVERVDS